MDPGPNGAMDVMSGWGMALGDWAWMAIWIVALLVMVWLIVAGSRERTPPEDAIDVLRARFARGEISQDEFERARNALLGDGRSMRGAGK